MLYTLLREKTFKLTEIAESHYRKIMKGLEENVFKLYVPSRNSIYMLYTDDTLLALDLQEYLPKLLRTEVLDCPQEDKAINKFLNTQVKQDPETQTTLIDPDTNTQCSKQLQIVAESNNILTVLLSIAKSISYCTKETSEEQLLNQLISDFQMNVEFGYNLIKALKPLQPPLIEQEAAKKNLEDASKTKLQLEADKYETPTETLNNFLTKLKNSKIIDTTDPEILSFFLANFCTLFDTTLHFADLSCLSETDIALQPIM